MPHRLALLGLAALTACAPAAPTRGDPVAPGVAAADFEVRWRGADLVRVRVLFPSDAGGAPRAGPALPGVVLVQGGFVEPARYQWLAEALAAEGYVVALPFHALNLAIVETSNAQAARALLAEPPAGSLLDGLTDSRRLAVGGHSLGGVVSVKAALGGGFRAAVLLAALPDPADAKGLPGLGIPTLSLAGALDCSAKLPSVREGWDLLPAPTALVVLPGVTHFQFTNSDDEDVRRDCPPQAPLEDAHRDIRAATVGFLEAALARGEVGEAALRAVPGAEVQVR